MTTQELQYEWDMLEGNINRMMVTDDKNELQDMTILAIRRILSIQKGRNKMLTDKEKDRMKSIDAISREQAYKALEAVCEKWHWTYGGEDKGTLGYDLAHVFDELPSVVPERQDCVERKEMS